MAEISTYTLVVLDRRTTNSQQTPLTYHALARLHSHFCTLSSSKYRNNKTFSSREGRKLTNFQLLKKKKKERKGQLEK